MNTLVGRFFKITSKIEDHELRAVLVSLVYLFSLMAAYSALRPFRDALASEIPTEQIKWLWTGTFVFATLGAVIFGWVVSRFKIASCLPWIYGFFIINIGIFYVLMKAYPLGSPETMMAIVATENWLTFGEAKVSTVVGGAFYIWLSVFNMFVISVFWSFLADRYTKEQSKRLFGFVAIGGSAGAAFGPLVAVLVSERFGTESLFVFAAVLLAISLACIFDLTSHTTAGHTDSETKKRQQEKLGGSSWSGFATLFKDPYLFAIALFICLYTFISTVFYLAQVDLVRAAFETREARTEVNAIVDLIVNGLAIFTQFFLTGRIAGRLGLVFLVACMPVFMFFAFFALSAAPVLLMVLGLQVVRRAGNFALTRPGREMLWTVVDRNSKYKAKNVIDNSVYRGADLVNVWIENTLRSLGFGLGQIALVGAGVAAAWAGTAIWLGKTAEKRKSEIEEEGGGSPQPAAAE